MLENWKSAVDREKSFSTLSTDMCKVLDCPHKLLLAKRLTYEFSIAAVRLIHSYLTNRKQRTKVNLPHSPWEEILFGVHNKSF